MDLLYFGVGNEDTQKDGKKEKFTNHFIRENLPDDFDIERDRYVIIGCKNPKVDKMEKICNGNLIAWNIIYHLRKEIFNLKDEYKEFCMTCMKCVCPVFGDEARCIGEECHYLKSCQLAYDH